MGAGTIGRAIMLGIVSVLAFRGSDWVIKRIESRGKRELVGHFERR